MARSPASWEARVALPAGRFGARAAGVPAFGVLALAAAGVSAQTAEQAATARSFSIVPSFSATQTFTNNADVSADDRHGDSITSISPGLRITSHSGRVRGFVDYLLSGLVYARDSDRNELQNTLNANVSAEAIEKWAYVDFNASIAQQSISAFGTQSADSSVANSNRAEVANYSLSPYVQGSFAGLADYEFRLTRNETRSDASNSFNTKSTTGSAHVSGGTAFSALGWNATASRQKIDYEASGRNTIDLLRLGVNYAVTPELRISANGGQERNNLLSPDQDSGATYGVGVDWRPNERTTLSAEQDHRLFGNAHDIRFSYRTPRTVWSFSDVRDVSSGTGAPTLGSLGTLYDLLFQQYASLEPDPTLRAQLVDTFLRNNGLDRNTRVLGNFLSSTVTLQRAQRFSFAWLGVRETVTLSALRTRSEPVDGDVKTDDSFANAASIRQTAFTVELSHRLTPQAALNLTGSQLKTSGNGNDDGQSSTLRSVSASWSGQVARRTSAVVGARYSKYGGTDTPYNESAVFASLRLEF